MHVFHGIDDLPSLGKKLIVAIGNFDGVHLGHQQILRLLHSRARQLSLPSAVLTFSPHTKRVTRPQKGRTLQMLQTLEQRLDAIQEFKIDQTIVIPFDERIARLPAEAFIEKYLVDRIRAAEIIVGENFRFGKNREGDIHLLLSLSKEYAFRVSPVPPVLIKNDIVSSSRIREHILKGEIPEANGLLGRPYCISGKVITGRGIGKKLGFPTANIETGNTLLPLGVFITSSRSNHESYPSLSFIGTSSLFHQMEVRVETFLIDRELQLYGKTLSIEFLKKIREGADFTTASNLKKQIRKDLEAAKKYFQNE